MKFTTLSGIAAVLGGLSSVYADAVPFERLDQNNSVLLIVDHQVGLYDNLARDFELGPFFRQSLAHAAVGKLFDLPVIITSSVPDGANGPVPDEILEMYPDVPVIPRQGEINAWDSPEFRRAIQDTGRTQFILGGVSTDVCTTFLALSLREQGYSVWANVEASATTSQLIRDASNSRMQAAGVQLVGVGSIVADLMRDWRNPSPGIANVSAFINQYVPAVSFGTRLYNAARNTTTTE